MQARIKEKDDLSGTVYILTSIIVRWRGDSLSFILRFGYNCPKKCEKIILFCAVGRANENMNARGEQVAIKILESVVPNTDGFIARVNTKIKDFCNEMRMSLEVSSSIGPITVSDTVIANIAGLAAIDCYGLVGMASRNQLKDGISDLLGRENLSKGIEVRQEENGEISIDLYIVVGFGTKISEVAQNVQSKIRYTLDQMLGLKVSQVNIFVQGVRLLNEE